MHSTSPTSDVLTSFKSARWAAAGWWLRSSKRVIEELRAVPTPLARAGDDGLEVEKRPSLSAQDDTFASAGRRSPSRSDRPGEQKGYCFTHQRKAPRLLCGSYPPCQTSGGERPSDR